MSGLRRLIVDTDTGADDVWAVVESLRAVDAVRVEAVTVVCGNFPLDLCVKNAMLAVEAAGTYLPPVYRGMERPLLTPEIFSAPHVHGSDGLGEMHLPPSDRAVEKKHAVQAMIELVMENPGQIELVTCGPLTNIAMAVLLEPRFARSVKKAWILGGSAGAPGNLNEFAEYNVGTDPEAAAIVLGSGMDTVWVTVDATVGDAEITFAEADRLAACGVNAGRFCARCAATLRRYYQGLSGLERFGVVDSLVMTAAIYPDIMTDVFSAHAAVELSPGERRGAFALRRDGPKDEHNAVICAAVDVKRYKNRLFALLGMES